MNKLLSWLYSLLRKESFQIDKRVPPSYLLYFLFNGLIHVLRGVILFNRVKPLAIASRGVRVIGSSKIKWIGTAKFGEYSYINSISIEGVRAGKNLSIGRYASIECPGSIKTLGKGLILGNNVGIGSFSFLGCAGGIEIGDDTIIGNYVSFHSENHKFTDIELPIRNQGVTHEGIIIGKNCWIGSKATILDGVIVEDGCIIAAGAVLIKGKYFSNSIYAGVPAKFIKSRLKSND
jgi:acetyltransferase-like isoleucine patch superfamily enzyme